MKKIFATFSILVCFMCLSFNGNTGCPNGNTGICVPIYGEGGTITHYICADPEGSAAPKDCNYTVIGTIE